jgi:hypothetical protein
MADTPFSQNTFGLLSVHRIGATSYDKSVHYGLILITTEVISLDLFSLATHVNQVSLSSQEEYDR